MFYLIIFGFESCCYFPAFLRVLEISTNVDRYAHVLGSILDVQKLQCRGDLYKKTIEFILSVYFVDTGRPKFTFPTWTVRIPSEVKSPNPELITKLVARVVGWNVNGLLHCRD